MVLKYRDGNWSSSSAVPSGLPLGPVKKLSEQELQKLAKSKMPAAQQRWLHILLTKQAEETLTQSEKQVLQKLHRLYTQGTIRKSEALAELKRRELQQPN
ncbi:hypothetical protein [Gloeobacter kilaueensis]|nr:hypothetical protein [Gloeobacter kilaueensis]